MELGIIGWVFVVTMVVTGTRLNKLDKAVKELKAQLEARK